MDLQRLRRLAAEVDDEHREAMRAIQDDRAHQTQHASRRAFLRGFGVGGSILTLGAAGAALAAGGASAQTTTTTGSTTSTVPRTTTTAPPKQPSPEDLVLLEFAQSLELAAVQVYEAAGAGGKLSDTTLLLAAAFGGHHLLHAQAFAGLAGKAALNIANQSLVATLVPEVEEAADERAVLTRLFGLETAMTATYTAGLGRLSGLNPATAVASIQPIEARHAVVIGEAIGLDLDAYVPTFEETTGAWTIERYPILGR